MENQHLEKLVAAIESLDRSLLMLRTLEAADSVLIRAMVQVCAKDPDFGPAVQRLHEARMARVLSSPVEPDIAIDSYRNQVREALPKDLQHLIA